MLGAFLTARRFAAAQEDQPGSSDRPRKGDLLVVSERDRAGGIIVPDDVRLGEAPLHAWPKDPKTSVVRNGSRLNEILLIRLDPGDMDEETRSRSAEGIVAYSAICTHAGCSVTGWLKSEAGGRSHMFLSQFRVQSPGKRAGLVRARASTSGGIAAGNSRRLAHHRCIGNCSLFRFDWTVPRGEIGYWCATNKVGHGYITEAILALTKFAWSLGLVRVEILCDAKNLRSRAVAERWLRLGGRSEKRLPQSPGSSSRWLCLCPSTSQHRNDFISRTRNSTRTRLRLWEFGITSGPSAISKLVLNLRFCFRIQVTSTQTRLRPCQQPLNVGAMANDHVEAASDHQQPIR